jgi:hypothetical protein
LELDASIGGSDGFRVAVTPPIAVADERLGWVQARMARYLASKALRHHRSFVSVTISWMLQQPLALRRCPND